MGFSFSYEIVPTEFTFLDAFLAHLYGQHSSGSSALTHTHTKLKMIILQSEIMLKILPFFFFSGYYGDGLNAIVVFAVCFMPESGQPNYRYLMDNLFK